MRGALCGSSGVMAWGLTHWWGGLAAALVTLAVHALWLRNRPGPVTSWRHGAMAERRTGRLLAKLDPAAFRILHDRALPGAPATNLDHLVIGLTGVYVIATRRWTPGVRLWSDQRRLWAGSHSAAHLHAAVVRAAHTVARLLAAELDRDVPVSALVSVHGARVPRTGLTFRGVTFQRARRVPPSIEGHPVVFTTAEVAMIALAAEGAFRPMLEIHDRALERRASV
ncbi:MAG: hypothetical protein JWO67_3653 [Streptosporangiaceae bacterium]|nr:hypothetical protein [Streptosporangiaceae bacterium]